MPTTRLRAGPIRQILTHTVLKLKALFRYRAQSLGIAAFSSEYKVLFDTFSFKKKYQYGDFAYAALLTSANAHDRLVAKVLKLFVDVLM